MKKSKIGFLFKLTIIVETLLCLFFNRNAEHLIRNAQFSIINLQFKNVGQIFFTSCDCEYAQTKNTEEISIEETSVICTVSEIVFFIESNPPFSFIDDISGSKRVDIALRKEAGKNMIGIVIPLIIPKRETERLLFNVCIKIASGTIRFSIV